MDTNDDIRAVNRSILLTRRSLDTAQARIAMNEHIRAGTTDMRDYILYTNQLNTLREIATSLEADLERLLARRTYLENLRGFNINRNNRTFPPAA